MTCNSGYFKGNLRNFDDGFDIAWMISLTQLLTTLKAHQQAGVNHFN